MSNLDRCYSVEDLRKAARGALPRVIYDFIEGGAEDEITVHRNRRSFNDYTFVPRVLRDVSKVDLATRIQGLDCSMPLLCAPTGMSRLFHYQGEAAVARAAREAGVPYVLSTVSTCSIEEIATLSDGPKFFQIYVWRNPGLVSEHIQRCRASGYDGIFLAVDLAALGKRERDLRNGHGRPIELRVKTGFGALTRPRWLFHYLTSSPLRMSNMVAHLPHKGAAVRTIDTVNEQFDPSVTWEDAQRLREEWGLPFIIKGVQCAEDARRAVSIGATGIVLSNHGGRQLDHAPAAMDILPEVVDAVGNDIEVIIDGGIRRGSDIVKAIALGAKATMIGRPYLYGLAAGGQAGVARVLEVFRSEMEQVMKLIGCDSVQKLDRTYVRRLG